MLSPRSTSGSASQPPSVWAAGPPRPVGTGRAGVGSGEERFAVADHTSRGRIGGKGARAPHGGADAAQVVAGHRLEGVVAIVDEREHGGRAVHRAQEAGADQRQAPVGAQLVDRPGGGVDQRQQRLGAQLLFLDVDEEALGMLLAWSTSHAASPHTLLARGANVEPVDRRPARSRLPSRALSLST